MWEQFYKPEFKKKKRAYEHCAKPKSQKEKVEHIDYIKIYNFSETQMNLETMKKQYKMFPHV